MNFKGFRFLQCLAVLLLVIFNQSCIPPSIGTEWKDYSKRYHVCFKDIVPGRTYNASHKFLYKTTFDVGTIFKVRGDFDPLDGAELPNDVFWTFEHVRKGNQLFQQSFTVPLNDKGKFSTFGAELT